jgi:hypothetical protein
MHRLRGTAAVRLTLWTLVFAAVAMALVQPAQAGTQAAPEIQDPANDQQVGGAAPACNDQLPPPAGPCVTFTRIDILSVWIDNETPTSINVHILLNNVPGAPNYYTSVWEFHATFGGTEVVSSATALGGSAPTAPAAGANTAAVSVDGNTLVMTIDKSVYGAPALVGGPLTGLFAVGKANTIAPLPTQTIASDRAPNDGAGTDYTMGAGGGTNATAGDADHDGLNDTCETKYFGNTTAQNASGDPDHDGLTNGQECALGTDPTKADTDGDGTNDKDDPYPTDPTRGGSNSTSSSSSSSSHSSSSSSSSSTSHSSSSSSSTGSATNGKGTKGAPKDLNEALDRLTSDPGYLGLSSGGFLAVLVLCIIGLAVRWSL